MIGRQELEESLLFIPKVVILIGILVILAGLTMTIHYVITKKRDKKLKESFWVTILGISIVMAALLLSYVIGYEPDYSGCGRSVLKWYILFLIGYTLYPIFLNKKETKEEQSDDLAGESKKER